MNSRKHPLALGLQLCAPHNDLPRSKIEDQLGGPLMVGNSDGLGGVRYDGCIYGVRILKRAISPSLIRKHARPRFPTAACHQDRARSGGPSAQAIASRIGACGLDFTAVLAAGRARQSFRHSDATAPCGTCLPPRRALINCSAAPRQADRDTNLSRRENSYRTPCY